MALRRATSPAHFITSAIACYRSALLPLFILHRLSCYCNARCIFMFCASFFFAAALRSAYLSQRRSAKRGLGGDFSHMLQQQYTIRTAWAMAWRAAISGKKRSIARAFSVSAYAMARGTAP